MRRGSVRALIVHMQGPQAGVSPEGYYLGREIAGHRNRRGWTQIQLADAAGISQSALKKYELGQVVPTVATLMKLGHALGVGAGRMMDDAEKAIKKRGR